MPMTGLLAWGDMIFPLNEPNGFWEKEGLADLSWNPCNLTELCSRLFTLRNAKQI